MILSRSGFAPILSMKQDGKMGRRASLRFALGSIPMGEFARLSVPTLNNAQADADLQTILKRGNVGEAPPPEMLQPLNLRFSLNLKK